MVSNLIHHAMAQQTELASGRGEAGGMGSEGWLSRRAIRRRGRPQFTAVSLVDR